MDNLVTANLKQRPVRTLVSILGVALGVALIMLFTGLARGMSNDLQRRSSNVKAEIIFARAGSTNLMSSSANLSTKYVDRLKEIDGVAAAVPVIRYIYQGGKGLGFEQVEGVDWDQYSSLNGMTIDEGRAPTASGEVVIDRTKANSNGLKIGSPLKLFGDREYKVVGIYSPESGARVKMPLKAMQEALEAPDKATWIYIKAANNVDDRTLADRINKELPGNTIQFTRDVFVSPEKSIPYLGVFLRVLVVLAAVVSGLVVMLAMYTTITERTREIGILKAMGASRGYIVGVIEKEAILISVLGLVVGFTAAVVAGAVIHRAYGLFFEYGWAWAAVAAGIGVLGGALGALYPAVRAANLDPVAALSYD
jgi:putative ABC transport system permease protein